MKLDKAIAMGAIGLRYMGFTTSDGAPRRGMGSRRLNALGGRPAVTLEQGLRAAYADFRGLLKLRG